MKDLRCHVIACSAILLVPAARPAIASGAFAQRIPIHRADDLPRHTYPIETTIAALLEDDREYATLAARIEADLMADLTKYDINDVATLKTYFGILSDLAVQRGDYADAVRWQDSIRVHEEKPALRQLVGIVERSLAAASPAEGAEFEAGFRESFLHEISALPYAEVQSELRMLRQGLEFLALPNAAALGRSAVEHLLHDGRLSLEGVQRLVGMRATLDRLLPVREAMVAVLNEVITVNEGVVKPDIWAARDVSLEGRDGLAQVIVAIWDSGVDVDLFPGQVFVNPGEVAGNGQDDDANGFVDDVHGIAHDLNHDRAAGVLARTTLSPEQMAEYAGHLRGSVDLRWGVQSAEALEYRRKIASITPTEIAAWIEGMNQYFDHVHGTHVARIAVRGNPAARVLVARNEEDNWKRIPQLVTLGSERKRAHEIRETVEYFKRNSVRVVNMSWALDPGFYADILQRNRAGGDAPERRRLTRALFDTVAAALRSTMEGAPEILFVAAAMNEDADNRLQELIPASFDLPNLITVGAVDNAGNEAAFTSHGKVDVYASGVEVRSFVPGGAVVPISGTSMAAPQVVNLAAKLLALRPDLTVAEVRRMIIETGDEKTIGDARSIRLMNPKAAVETLRRR